MTQENYYKGIKHVVHISTDVTKGCEHCSFLIGGENFSESINHYIEQHGYKLLHVGTETIHNQTDGSSWHMTIAILGK